MDIEYSDSQQNIGIRPYQTTDIPLLYEAVRESIPHMYPFMPWCHPAYSLEEAKQWVLSRPDAWQMEEYSFVIFSQDTELIGGIGINFINRVHQFGNLGYWIRRSALGENRAAQAAKLALRFAWEELKLQRLEIVVATTNTASQQVANKLGAQQEGILRNRLRLHGKSVDAIMYSLIPNVPE